MPWHVTARIRKQKVAFVEYLGQKVSPYDCGVCFLFDVLCPIVHVQAHFFAQWIGRSEMCTDVTAAAKKVQSHGEVEEGLPGTGRPILHSLW